MINKSKNNRGVALITALIFMLALLLIGVAIMNVVTMGERMVGNDKDTLIAMQAAEAALRDAENDVAAHVLSTTEFTENCTSGFCLPPTLWATASSLPIEQQASFSWTNAAQIRLYGQYTQQPAYGNNVAMQPRYVIEKLGLIGTPAGESAAIGTQPTTAGTAYRITAMATGKRADTVVVLQSIYVKR